METVVTKKLYEGMFLVDSAQASNWDATIATLESVLKRTDAEIVSIRKWDERRLAYEINGKSRGTYILCYFRADGEKIPDIEKAVQLSEQIMRVLILSAEQMSPEDIEKDTPAMKAEKEEAARDASSGSSEPKIPEEPAAETGEATTAGVTEQASEAEETTEPQKSEPSTKAGASAEAESEQTKEQAQR